MINLGGGYMPVRFWGLGYKEAQKNKVAKYMRSDFRSEVEYMRHIVGGVSLGAGVEFRYASCQDASDKALQYLQNSGTNSLSASTTGIGATIKYDGRYYISQENTTKGVFVQLGGAVHPKALGSHHNTLWHIEATANYYQPLWRGGMLAFDLFADMWSWETPWQFWAKVGGDNRMRGYYYGKYTDRNMISAQVELRQRIYGILSGVVWGGAGSVFSKYKYFDIDHLLPNYGVGIRVAIARNLSFRVDYGFGRHSRGLIINVNEAF
jgi:outer membrane protein assembly factor BamA